MLLRRIVLAAGLICAALGLYYLARSFERPPMTARTAAFYGAFDPSRSPEELQRQVYGNWAWHWQRRALAAGLPAAGLLALAAYLRAVARRSSAA